MCALCHRELLRKEEGEPGNEAMCCGILVLHNLAWDLEMKRQLLGRPDKTLTRQTHIFAELLPNYQRSMGVVDKNQS